MNWNAYHAMVGDVSFFIDRISDMCWELWYMSPADGHRTIGSAPSPDQCMSMITPENFAARGITLDAICVGKQALGWVRCSPTT
jgi:hypothetical protein